MLATLVADRLRAIPSATSIIDVRALPAPALVEARQDDPAIKAAVSLVAQAELVVIASPTYKASYSGLLKTFLDLLPQYGLRGKVVLPLATGATLAHVLMIDYALRPMLSSMDPMHLSNGLFFMDSQLQLTEDGGLDLAPDLSNRLDALLSAAVTWRPGIEKRLAQLTA